MKFAKLSTGKETDCDLKMPEKMYIEICKAITEYLLSFSHSPGINVKFKFLCT